jgi:2-amino-4-hydroxy-6-hydroxymethyldihydropteridine diphosphokinase/dihydropteroate synthase
MVFAIGIGSNLGNRISNIERGINLLKEYGIRILKTSLIYQNKALVLESDKGREDYDIDFFNLVVLCDFFDITLIPLDLLSILKKIEKDIGRVESSKWSPRIIDLDLLFYDDVVLKSERLNLPHQGICERPFVLLPLLQISGDWIYPDDSNVYYNKSIAEICQEKKISKDDFVNVLPLNPKIMGIVNVTNDSFSGDGYLNDDFNSEKICNEIWQKFLDGASVLDFGFQSTRPNASVIDVDEEIRRAKIIMDDFFNYKYLKSKIVPEVSIDSFYPEVIQYCINNYRVDIVNDVSGLERIELLDCVANSERKIVLMHNLGIPSDPKRLIDFGTDVIEVLFEWFDKKIQQVLGYQGGLIKESQIILDPGLGFGKSIYYQWEIVRRIHELKEKFNLPILFGHSRKSFLKNISNGDDRVYQTLGVSLSVAKSVDYLRIHDVGIHCEALSSFCY